MTQLLHNYVAGQWQPPTGSLVTLANAINGQPVAQIASSSAIVDTTNLLRCARERGGPALQRLSFQERASRLKALAKFLLEHKERFYALSAATGATRTDSWIDIEGGIATLFAFAGIGRRELPDGTVFTDGPVLDLSRNGNFIGQHIYTSRRGVAVQINAFNFPCWGMLEKLAPALLAGVPTIVKPASQTAYVTEAMFRQIIASGVFPPDSLQLICGGVGDLLTQLDGQDSISFTGSAQTGQKLKSHPTVIAESVRFALEADSLNAAILGPDVEPGDPEFELFITEVVQEMRVKAGQKCTAIRRALIPAARTDAVLGALSERLKAIVVGDPANADVTMGPLASLDQRSEVLKNLAAIRAAGSCETIVGAREDSAIRSADPQLGAFCGPQLLFCAAPRGHPTVHSVEAFGPVCTVMPYSTVADAVELSRAGGGSLVASLFCHDAVRSSEIALGIACQHGRILIVDRDCAKDSTGHGSPLPGLIHGGPGRAGGGEELGGIRCVKHYMQRSALQGSPASIAATVGQWLPGAKRHDDGIHPFRKNFNQLEIGDTITTASRTISLQDIDHFAQFTGDTFYAHMDHDAAAANPFFEGRVAHGYLIVSLAAGLFVDPDPGPVLANYGVDSLRFTQPVYPGDSIKVILTCKQKTGRVDQPHGEVRWDTTVLNQNGDIVAQYDVLTLVAAATDPLQQIASNR